jgi:hypothetical protein
MTTINGTPQNDNSDTVDSDLGPNQSNAGNPGVIIRPKPNYTSLDEAAMAAAKEIYDTCENAQWDVEYAIVIHKHKFTRKYHLTTIIRGTIHRVDGIGAGIALGRGKYQYVSDLHSHLIRSSIINEPSGIDYYRSLLNNVPTYVVVYVGDSGVLIKFTPPRNRGVSSKGSDLFDNKARILRGIGVNGTVPTRDEILSGIREIPRHTKNEFITEIIGKNDRQRRRNGLLQETPIGDNIRLEPLDPQTILWKSSVSDARMASNGYHGLRSNSDATNNSSLRYRERESTYDARHTVIKLDFPADTAIIEKAFVGFTAVKNMDILSHVTEIGKEAFRDCTGLENVTFNGNVNTIGEGAFRGCQNLEIITLLHNQIPPRIWPETFEGLHSDVKFIVPDDSVEVYRNAEHWNVFGGRIMSKHDAQEQ